MHRDNLVIIPTEHRLPLRKPIIRTDTAIIVLTVKRPLLHPLPGGTVTTTAITIGMEDGSTSSASAIGSSFGTDVTSG